MTGKLSPDPDTHVLRGALVYGSGKSDDFADERDAPSSQVGVENSAGLAAALAGVLEVSEWAGATATVGGWVGGLLRLGQGGVPC